VRLTCLAVVVCSFCCTDRARRSALHTMMTLSNEDEGAQNEVRMHTRNPTLLFVSSASV
jgi:hypothetical protein